MAHRGEFQEWSLMQIRDALDRYARHHKLQCGAPIGNDSVLSVEWLRILSGLRGLLNGETGAIDCGEFSRMLTYMRESHGMTQKDEDDC